MAAHRRYAWRYRPAVEPWPDAVRNAEALRAQAFLADLCEAEPQFYTDPKVTVVVFGWIEIHLTVSAKDRWKIPWRVRRKLLPGLLLALGSTDREDLTEVESTKLPPHRHPNRAARWRKA